MGYMIAWRGPRYLVHSRCYYVPIVVLVLLDGRATLCLSVQVGVTAAYVAGSSACGASTQLLLAPRDVSWLPVYKDSPRIQTPKAMEIKHDMSGFLRNIYILVGGKPKTVVLQTALVNGRRRPA